MSPNQAPAFVVVALLLFAAASPLAYGQPVKGFTVNGQFCCSSTGNCPAGATGIPGVLVLLNCTSPLAGGSITVGQAVTGLNGIFNISVPNALDSIANIPSILSGGIPCVTIVNLPLNQTVCPILSTTTGILAGLLTFLNTVVSPVLGRIANFVVVLFVRVVI